VKQIVTYVNGASGHPGDIEWDSDGNLVIPEDGVKLYLTDSSGPVVGKVVRAWLQGPNECVIVAEVKKVNLEAVLEEVGDRLVSVAAK
jgi:hypothetical protein